MSTSVIRNHSQHWKEWLVRTTRRGRSALSAAGPLALIDQGIFSVTAFATNAVVARACSKEDFGIYFVALSLLFFVRGIQEQLISAPYTTYSRRRRNRSALAVYTGSVFVHQVVLSVVLLASLFIGSLVVSHIFGHQHRLASALRVLLAVTPFFLLRDHLRKVAFARFQFSRAVVADTAVSVLQLSGIWLLWHHQLLTSITAYLVIAVACGTVSLIWISRNPFPLLFHHAMHQRAWSENWKFGRWAFATFLIGCSAPHLLPWMALTLKDETTVGLLGAALTLVGVGNMFITGMANYLHPAAARAYATGGQPALSRALSQANSVFLLVLGAFCVGFILFGGWLPGLLFGAKYGSLWGTVIVLSFAMLANGIGLVAGNGLWAMNKPAANLGADVSVLVTTVTIALAWIPAYGVLGAAWAWFLGAAIGAGARWATLTLVMSGRLRKW